MNPEILKMIDELDRLRPSRDDHWQVPRVEGELLHHIALATGAKLIVEVGTSYGFSGLFWAAALKRIGGKLQTIDISQKKFDSSRETFNKAGVADLIQNHLGDAAAILPMMPAGIDIVFLDAGDKSLARSYFDLIWPKVRIGGSVLTDNVTTHREALADFVRYTRDRSDANGSEIPVGNGLEWTVKIS